jgi:DNA-directed RNA polymerase specialized sigma24 family protein
MNGHDWLAAQKETRDLWPRRFLGALRAGLADGEAEVWLPEFTRRFRNRVPDFAGAGLFATLARVEGMETRELADYIIGHVYLALRRNQPREEAAFVDYVRRCVRSVAVTMRRQSLDSVHRAAARDGELQILSLDEHPALLEALAGHDPDAAAQLSGQRVVVYLLAQAERDGQRENVEIVLRTTLDDMALADIARERGVSRQAIAKRYQRGMAYLQAHREAAFGGSTQ